MFTSWSLRLGWLKVWGENLWPVVESSEACSQHAWHLNWVTGSLELLSRLGVQKLFGEIENAHIPCHRNITSCFILNNSCKEHMYKDAYCIIGYNNMQHMTSKQGKNWIEPALENHWASFLSNSICQSDDKYFQVQGEKSGIIVIIITVGKLSFDIWSISIFWGFLFLNQNIFMTILIRNGKWSKLAPRCFLNLLSKE